MELGSTKTCIRVIPFFGNMRALKSVFEPTCSASLIEEQETESIQSRDPLPAVHRSSEAASTHGNLDFSHASSLWVGRTASMLD